VTVLSAAVITLIAAVPIAPQAFFVAFMLTWNYFLLRALRWLWIVTVVLLAIAIPIDLVTGSGTWHGNLTGAIELGLLLAPATRRFFRAAEPAAADASNIAPT
jgi:hypothetical protein